MKINVNSIENIFIKNNIEDVFDVATLDIGFTNDIYIVNDKYILKVCVDEGNEPNFLKEINYYEVLRGEIPIPNVIVADTTKSLISKYYMIYKKIEGENLYATWHLLNNDERKDIIKQLAKILNNINSIDYLSIGEKLNVNKNITWHDIRYNSLIENLNNLKSKDTLDTSFTTEIENYIEDNHHTLHEQKIGITYCDLHFENVLVKNKEVTALLDFERVDVLSIDYALDTIKKLSERPNIYACEAYEKYVKREDYKEIILWFREYYPDLFDFKDIDTRLSLYAIEYDMRLLLKFPEVQSLKDRLLNTIRT